MEAGCTFYSLGSGGTWKPDVLFESHHIGRSRGLPKVGVPLLNICHSGCMGMMPRAFCICVAGFKESEVKSAVDGLMQVPLSDDRAAGRSLQTAGQKSTIGSAMMTIDYSFSICFVNGSLAWKSSSQFSGSSALIWGPHFDQVLDKVQAMLLLGGHTMDKKGKSTFLANLLASDTWQDENDERW